MYKIYEGQIKTAIQILESLPKYTMLIAEPQSGKTGILKYVIDNCGYNTIYYICGMNDNYLKMQQYMILSHNIKDKEIKILFSKDLEKYCSSYNDYNKNIDFSKTLFIVDESHYAQDKKNLPDDFFMKVIGIRLNGENIENNKISIISVSATPMTEIANNSLIKNKNIIIHYPDQNYYGIKKMLENNHIHESFNLKNENDLENFYTIINKQYMSELEKNKYTYILLRINNNNDGKNIQKKIIEKYNNEISSPIIFLKCSYKNKNLSFLKKIHIIPKKTTIIFIHNSLRAGIQLNTENISYVFETKEARTDTTVQGLVGRCCGYNKEKHHVEIFCNIKNINEYINWINNHYDVEYIPHKSKNIKKIKLINGQNYENDIPILIDINNNKLLNDLETYNNELINKGNKVKRYTNFDNLFYDRILELVNKNKLNNTYLIGKTILDHTFKTNEKTGINMLNKWWEPAVKASINKKHSSYFYSFDKKNTNKEKLKDKNLIYIYINLCKQHDDYGKIILCVKRLQEIDTNKKIKTTKKECYDVSPLLIEN